MDSGRISEVGSYEELKDNDGAFAEFLCNYANIETDQMEGEPGKFPVCIQLSHLHGTRHVYSVLVFCGRPYLSFSTQVREDNPEHNRKLLRLYHLILRPRVGL